MNNLKLLQYSISHSEQVLDGSYMFIERHKDIIKQQINVHGLHFVSFLDGVYFNLLFLPQKSLENGGKIANKLRSQKSDILSALRRDKGNYFINTAGFRKLFAQ